VPKGVRIGLCAPVLVRSGGSDSLDDLRLAQGYFVTAVL